MSIFTNTIKTKPILIKLIQLNIMLCIILGALFLKAYIAFHIIIISYFLLLLFSDRFQSEFGISGNFKITVGFILFIYLLWFIQPARQFRPNTDAAIFIGKPWSLEVMLFLVFGQIQFIWSVIYLINNVKNMNKLEFCLLLIYGVTFSCVSILSYFLLVIK